ncbi:hypothetical protein DCCM_2828 [Desulfocucumis palustris]|uniref:Uncharacterized protein n=1 Tax=Desulfocucumis palustris TaxID=1898651 RepID=A0A2L2XC92_9FIRM|nr:hypothetical protein [Desulfocucumis palustris]GBF33722.1 hypothetical protein DCCM_2828 [Desulfocucumis palustris]
MNYDLRLDGKVAIINGGAMGLGKGIANGPASFGLRRLKESWKDWNRY